MEIKYTKKSVFDLENLFKFISLDKPKSAKMFIDLLDKNILLLSSNPQMGKECKGIKGDCRVLVYEKNYLIVYKIHTNYISIIKIINTKQHKGKK